MNKKNIIAVSTLFLLLMLLIHSSFTKENGLDQGKLDDLYRQAELLIDENTGDSIYKTKEGLLEAMHILEEIIENNPKEIKALELLRDSYMSLGIYENRSYKEKRNELRDRIWGLSPDSTKTKIQKIRNFYTGHQDRVLKFKELLKSNIDKCMVYYVLAGEIRFYSSSDSERAKALDYYRQAYECDDLNSVYVDDYISYLERSGNKEYEQKAKDILIERRIRFHTEDYEKETELNTKYRYGKALENLLRENEETQKADKLAKELQELKRKLQ